MIVRLRDQHVNCILDSCQDGGILALNISINYCSCANELDSIKAVSDRRRCSETVW